MSASRSPASPPSDAKACRSASRRHNVAAGFGALREAGEEIGAVESPVREGGRPPAAASIVGA